MDAHSLALLRRLIAMAGRSLLQYVSESSPWTTPASQEAFTQIIALAQEERDAVSKWMRYMQKHHQPRVVLGSYPVYFTTMNYITVDHLLPLLIAENTHNLSELDRILVQESDEEVRTMIQAYREMKQRHLQTLKALATPKEKAAV